MFDRTYVVPPYPSSQHNTHTHTHHEHRAPTDESVQLLREMEKAAQDAVIERIDLKNGVKGTIVRRMSLGGFEHEIVMAFELNGEKYQTKPFPVPILYTFDKHEWVKKLIEGMSEAIALKLLEKGFKELGL